MNTITLRRGADGKKYLDRPLTRTERNQARWLEHNLVHRDHLSIRAAQKVMAESYHVRRSIGIIVRDLRDFECPHCPDVNT